MKVENIVVKGNDAAVGIMIVALLLVLVLALNNHVTC